MKTEEYADFNNTRELAIANDGEPWSIYGFGNPMKIRFSKFTELLGFLSEFEKRYDNIVTWTHEYEGNRIGYLATVEKYYDE